MEQARRTGGRLRVGMGEFQSIDEAQGELIGGPESMDWDGPTTNQGHWLDAVGLLGMLKVSLGVFRRGWTHAPTV